MANKMETGLKGRWTFYFDNMEADQINAPHHAEEDDNEFYAGRILRNKSGAFVLA